MPTSKEHIFRSGEQPSKAEALLGEPQIGISLPELQLNKSSLVLGLPFKVFEGKTMRIPNGKKIGRISRASVPLEIPLSTLNKKKLVPNHNDTNIEQIGHRLLNSLLETQERELNGETRSETVCYFPYETFKCFFQPELSEKILERTKPPRKLPTIKQAKKERDLNFKRHQQIFEEVEKKEKEPVITEDKLLSDISENLVKAAISSSSRGLPKATLLSLREIRRMFKSSDFSVSDFMGSDGVIRHQDLIDGLDFELHLDPLSTQRAALLELCLVVPESSAPGLHLLTRMLAAYDKRMEENKNRRFFTQESEEGFFKEGVREVPGNLRANISEMRERYTEVIKNKVREIRKSQAVDSDALLSALLAFHEVDSAPGSPYLAQKEQLSSQLAKKDILEMSHEEIAFLLSIDFEKSTDPTEHTTENEVWCNKVKELNDAGLFYFNMDFYQVHDPNTFHGAFITLPDGTLSFDWCPVHTPPLALQLSSISIPTPSAFSLPVSFPGLEMLSAIGNLGQGLALVSQATALTGVSLAGSFLEGENFGSGKSDKKDDGDGKERESKSKKPAQKPILVFPSLSRSADVKSTRTKEKEQSSQPSKPKLEKPIKAKPKPKKKKTRPASTLVSTTVKKVAKEKPTPKPRKTEKKVVVVPKVKSKKETAKPTKKKKKLKKTAEVPQKKVEVKPVPLPTKKPEPQATPISENKPKSKKPIQKSKPAVPAEKPPQKRTVTPAAPRPRLRRIYNSSDFLLRRIEKAIESKSSEKVVAKPAQEKVSSSQSEQVSSSSKQEKTKAAPVIKQKEKQAETPVAEEKKQTDVVSKQEQKVAEKPVEQEKVKETAQPDNDATTQKEEVVEEHTEFADSEIATDVETLAETNESENAFTTAAQLAVGTVFETAKRVWNIQPLKNSVESEVVLSGSPADPEQPSTKEGEVNARLLRKRAEYGGRRGGSGSTGDTSTKKKQKVTPLVQPKKSNKIEKKETTQSVAMLRLADDKNVDMTDSFSIMINVKSWVNQALDHPKLMQEYYDVESKAA
jgi:hypothetical protein